MRTVTLVALAGVLGAALLGCVTEAEKSNPNEAMEIDCRGVPCDWVTLEGAPRYGATWHDGDIGVDLSGNGRVVVEQRVVLLPLRTRQLELEAAIVRDAGVTLQIELDFYAPGGAPGPTFWERSPVLLLGRSVDVYELGVARIHREVLIPSEAAGVVVRLVKTGNGRAMVDEFSLGHP